MPAAAPSNADGTTQALALPATGGADSGEPTAAVPPKNADANDITPAKSTWAALAATPPAETRRLPAAPAPNAAGTNKVARDAVPAAGGKQEASGAMTDEDSRYDRLFKAIQEIVEQLKKVPLHKKAHCGIIAQALMIRHCLSEWFKNELHTFTKSKHGFITSCEIDIKTLMLSVEDVTECTLQEQAVCIFPKGTKPFYSISTNGNLLLHNHRALDMYNNFTQVVTKVFKQYFPDFGAENKYHLPIPFVFAGALESRRDANRDSDDLIDEMIKSWPKQKTNISLKNF